MLKYLISIMSICLLLSGCGSRNYSSADIVKMPYKEWSLGGKHPEYFGAYVISSSMVSQSNQFHGLRIAIRPNSGDNPGVWHMYQGSSGTLNVRADLPKIMFFCWISFVDQTFYRTELVISKEIREKMVEPYKYMSPSTGGERVVYRNLIVLGFAPGGNVTAWLAGIAVQPWIEFAQLTSTNLGADTKMCQNPYINGKIPEISTEAKEWLKQHGMPAHWQEKPDLNQPIN